MSKLTNSKNKRGLQNLSIVNPADTIDIGFFGDYNDSVAKYSGLFRDADDSGQYKFFAELEEKPIGDIVNTSGLGFKLGDVGLNNVYVNNFVHFTDTSIPDTPVAGEGVVYKKTGNPGLFWKSDNLSAELDLTYTPRRCDVYYNPPNTAVETNLIAGSWVDIPMYFERYIDSNFTHVADSPEITINATDIYMITARCSTYIVFGTLKNTCQMRLALNTGGGYNGINSTIGYMYNKEAGASHNTATVTIIQQFSFGDKVKLQAFRITDNSSIVAVPAEGSSLTITKV